MMVIASPEWSGGLMADLRWGFVRTTGGERDGCGAGPRDLTRGTMNDTGRLTRRLGLAAIASALATACAPLSLFATLTPKDPAARSARNVAYGPQAWQRLDV